MEAIAIQKFIHISPRKLMLVAQMVRNMDPNKALEVLRFTNKASAEDLSKAIKTALANAKQKGMNSTIFKALEINEGPRLKRFRAGAKGRAKPYKKRTSHIKIVLTDDIEVKSPKVKVKVDDVADKSKLIEGGRTESSK